MMNKTITLPKSYRLTHPVTNERCIQMQEYFAFVSIHYYRVAIDSTNRAVSVFDGCISWCTSNAVVRESVRISDDCHSSDKSYGWLVRDLVSHYTNHMVDQAGLTTV